MPWSCLVPALPPCWWVHSLLPALSSCPPSVTVILFPLWFPPMPSLGTWAHATPSSLTLTQHNPQNQQVEYSRKLLDLKGGGGGSLDPRQRLPAVAPRGQPSPRPWRAFPGVRGRETPLPGADLAACPALSMVPAGVTVGRPHSGETQGLTADTPLLPSTSHSELEWRDGVQADPGPSQTLLSPWV